MASDSFDTGGLSEELFTQNSVLVKSLNPPCDEGVDFEHNVGTLRVVEYPISKQRFLEWTQCELIVETEDQEWTLVQQKKIREFPSPPTIKMAIDNIKSFQVTRHGSQILIIENDGKRSVCFSFQRGSALNISTYLTSILPTTKCRKAPGLHVVIDEPVYKNLNQSFAELDIFPENKGDVVWSFMQKLHNHPYETALNAFSKVTDVLLHRPDDIIAERLASSFSDDELPKRNDEYEFINLPSVPLPERIPPLSETRWTSLFTTYGRIIDSDTVEEEIFRGGVDPSIRKEVWMYLLGFYPWNASHEEKQLIKSYKCEEYSRMKQQWCTMSKDQEDRFSHYKERKSLIQKDVARTDRTVAFYANDDNPNLDILHNILMTYVMYNFDLGYVQGMSDILSPLLMLFQDEVETFWCFTTAISRMIRNFDEDQAGMKEQLGNLYTLLTTVDPELAGYLNKQESSNMFFCFRWLLVWFKREFPFRDIYILWETLWTKKECKNYHLLVCLAILTTERDVIIRNEYGFTEILKHINELSDNIDLVMTLRVADKLYNQLSRCDEVPNTTRSILGFPLLPAAEVKSPKMSKASSPSMETITNLNVPEEDEAAYEDSINSQFF